MRKQEKNGAFKRKTELNACQSLPMGLTRATDRFMIKILKAEWTERRSWPAYKEARGMTIDTLLDQLTQARKECQRAREKMNSAKTKKAWREAEEDLNSWQGKTAWIEAHLAKEAR